MKIALAALKGEKVDPITMIPYVLVTPENIKIMLNKSIH